MQMSNFSRNKTIRCPLSHVSVKLKNQIIIVMSPFSFVSIQLQTVYKIRSETFLWENHLSFTLVLGNEFQFVKWIFYWTKQLEWHLKAFAFKSLYTCSSNRMFFKSSAKNMSLMRVMKKFWEIFKLAKSKCHW